MKSKYMILTGLGITSLITALILAKALPTVLLAFTALSLGLLLTYYWALSWKRGEYAGKQRMLLRYAEELYTQKTAQDIDSLLIQWAARITEGEPGIARRQGVYWVYHGIQPNEEIINSGLDMAVQKGETIQIEPGNPYGLALPPQTRVWLEIPLYQGKCAVGVFHMQKQESLFLKGDIELLESMSSLASRAYTNMEAEKNKQLYSSHLMYSLLHAIESTHPEFIGHHERVASIAGRLGEKLALSVQEQKELHFAALLHDIGKIPAAVQVEDDESEGIKQHPILGSELLPDDPDYEPVKQGIRYHHERYNGSGYPEGLKATEIPLIARIIAVADVYDALTSICSEEERLNHEEAVTKIRMASGTGLDPLVIVALEEIEPLPDQQA